MESRSYVQARTGQTLKDEKGQWRLVAVADEFGPDVEEISAEEHARAWADWHTLAL
jgi:hypothetical protein